MKQEKARRPFEGDGRFTAAGDADCKAVFEGFWKLDKEALILTNRRLSGALIYPILPMDIRF